MPFVKEKEPTWLRVLLQDLSRRFGNDFDVRGEHGPWSSPTCKGFLVRTRRARGGTMRAQISAVPGCRPPSVVSQWGIIRGSWAGHR